jgi:hypothetical protein
MAHLAISILTQPAFGQRNQGKENLPIVFTMIMEINQMEDGEGRFKKLAKSDDTCKNKEYK